MFTFINKTIHITYFDYMQDTFTNFDKIFGTFGTYSTDQLAASKSSLYFRAKRRHDKSNQYDL